MGETERRRRRRRRRRRTFFRWLIRYRIEKRCC